MIQDMAIDKSSRDTLTFSKSYETKWKIKTIKIV